ncbi:MAG TPA: PP2C family protein-serine/threonine phosphatase, partial [Micromonospora sp.]
LRISLAGHLPPMLAVPGRPVELTPLPVDPPLGTGRPQERLTATVELPTGTTFVCYTDGLIERRDETIDVGFDRLRAAIRPGTAEETCAAIMSNLDVHRPDDDIALLVVHRHAS